MQRGLGFRLWWGGVAAVGILGAVVVPPPSSLRKSVLPVNRQIKSVATPTSG